MAKASGLMPDSGKGSIEDAKLRQLEDELSKAQAIRLDRQSKLELASHASVDSLPEILDDPTIRDYTIKLTDLRRQYAELNATYTPAHYRVKEVQDAITAMEAALNQARTHTLSRIRDEYESAKRHEDLLSKACEEQLKVVFKESNSAVQFNMLKHEVDTSRQLYEVLLQRVKEAGVASAMRAGNVLIVDPARKPIRPYKPNFLMNSLIGFTGGLFVGIAFVIFREQANKSVRDPGELSRQINVPELGAIPEARQRFLQTAPYPLKPLALLVDEGFHGQQAQPCLELVTWNQKPSFIAESFRATLPSILFSHPSEGRPRILVTSSPNPGEGKTTIATNLAIAIAEITQRVLIVDGDLRKPRLHRIFNVSNEFGLSDLLSADEPVLASRLSRIIRPTQVKGLSVLTSGSETQDTSSLFYSRRLPELLRILREKFDTVIIDTPPVLQIPDGRLLARFADGIIMVVRAGRTARDSAVLAHQRFAEDGSRVLGTILNSWDPGSMHRYAYSNWK
jgi:capsular exopolysaccharide synthesis family protein